MFCQPQASPVSLTNSINAMKKTKGYATDWKVISVAIGDYLNKFGNMGLKIVKNMVIFLILIF